MFYTATMLTIIPSPEAKEPSQEIYVFVKNCKDAGFKDI